MSTVGDLTPPDRLLCGTGPTNPDPRVLRALAAPVLGQFDPAFTAIMEEVMALARQVFQTANPRTFAVSGTGRAGMEAAIASLVEPGDPVLVAACGRFGDLFADLAARYGARVEQVTAEWGQVIDPQQIDDALRVRRAKVVAVVHGETSTGVLQPHMDAIGRICRRHDALLVVDAVVTLGGVEVDVDGWQADVCTSGTQKCLGCPSGMAPVTYNGRAEEVLARRRTPIISNYLDLAQLQRYWSPERLNHHTLPTAMTYGLREALRLVVEEGLPARWARHRRTGDALKAGLEAMGLRLFGDPRHRLPMITAVHVPDGVPDEAARLRLLEEFGVEIATSFGPLRGRIWRIGTMGYNARPTTVLTVLSALEHVLRAFGVRIPPAAGVEEARRRLAGDSAQPPR
ncbi:MAG: alanine--glyoxylate aminotransferase family protein [Armatimonadota bacterium]|nr:alanine--glyoxylate aminotransferase family protein [Armatimonadota bacterium]MDR7401750.1 alanine--glyoxylate aminotransferase family protein [Armatimonadota bacterium]MDR7404142.1 alanine--glyoxylate aminotransferase family protein [Armatimonadota bacterium]MDR7436247.1 alanine--glyoxylate aminotransferase family protein [Armatimonadota bacterium]MDR7471373.1 alanine--glyoxylate aminotransferase family protein [Armatimonadota bacterium]